MHILFHITQISPPIARMGRRPSWQRLLPMPAGTPTWILRPIVRNVRAVIAPNAPVAADKDSLTANVLRPCHSRGMRRIFHDDRCQASSHALGSERTDFPPALNNGGKLRGLLSSRPNPEGSLSCYPAERAISALSRVNISGTETIFRAHARPMEPARLCYPHSRYD